MENQADGSQRRDRAAAQLQRADEEGEQGDSKRVSTRWHMRYLKAVITFSPCISHSAPAPAGSDGGHQLISAIVLDRLPAAQQATLLKLLAQHPRYEQDFKLPENFPGSKTRCAEWSSDRCLYRVEPVCCDLRKLLLELSPELSSHRLAWGGEWSHDDWLAG